MNRLTKRILSAFLAMAMIVTLVPPVTAQAATKTQKMTLYVGEAVNLSYYNADIKSISSSKKSVVKVAKVKGEKRKATLDAKKAGKATVTVKTNKGNEKYVITVKKFDISIKMTEMAPGKILLTIKNNTSQTFNFIKVAYTLYSPDGEPLVKDEKTVDNVVAKKTVYDTISYSTYQYNVDVTQCVAKAKVYDLYGGGRSLSRKYKNQSSNVTVKDSIDGQKITLTSKNKSNKTSVQGNNYILLYDENGKVVDMLTSSFYLKAGGMDTNSRSIYTEYATYKIVTVAYSSDL